MEEGPERDSIRDLGGCSSDYSFVLCLYRAAPVGGGADLARAAGPAGDLLSEQFLGTEGYGEKTELVRQDR